MGCKIKMSQRMTNPTKWTVHPVKTQISLGIRTVRSESSLGASFVAMDPLLLHADSEDWSDSTGAWADLSIRWAHITVCWFCHAVAQIKKKFNLVTPMTSSVWWLCTNIWLVCLKIKASNTNCYWNFCQKDSLAVWNGKVKWAAAWQNQQNDICAQRKLRSA